MGGLDGPGGAQPSEVLGLILCIKELCCWDSIAARRHLGTILMTSDRGRCEGVHIPWYHSLNLSLALNQPVKNMDHGKAMPDFLPLSFASVCVWWSPYRITESFRLEKTLIWFHWDSGILPYPKQELASPWGTAMACHRAQQYPQLLVPH